MDYQGLNDRTTSTEQTSYCKSFRRDVLLRDGSCFITGTNATLCDAAHLIHRRKGDEYIAKVVDIRSHLYSQPPEITGIDDAQNGMLMKMELHMFLGRGVVAFLKTPNYGLGPADIKRVDLVGSAHMDHHITLQQLKKPQGDDPGRLADELARAASQSSTANSIGILGAALCYGGHLDVQFWGPQPPPSLPPPALILDYMYGIASYKRWRNGDKVHAIMENCRSANYEHIPPFPRHNHNNDDGRKPWEDGMVAAMDELNSVLMRIQGITPQEAAIRSEKRMEDEELNAQEASRSKVMEWMKTMAVDGS